MAKVLPLVRELGSVDHEILLAILESMLHREAGDPLAAGEAGRRRSSWPRTTGDHWMLGQAYDTLGTASLCRGDNACAAEQFRTAIEHATAVGTDYVAIQARVGLAVAERDGTGLEWALDDARTRDFGMLAGMALAGQAQLRFGAGDRAGAAGRAAEALAIQGRTGWRIGRAARLTLAGRG